MNDFERLNLQRLKSLGYDGDAIHQGMNEAVKEDLQEISTEGARQLVQLLFEKHMGDAAKVKEELRQTDKELLTALGLTDIANATYQHLQSKAERYSRTRWAH